MTYRAPFPWFGGKSLVAPLVWPRLGSDAANYAEPFFGSGATALVALELDVAARRELWSRGTQ